MIYWTTITATSLVTKYRNTSLIGSVNILHNQKPSVSQIENFHFPLSSLQPQSLALRAASQLPQLDVGDDCLVTLATKYTIGINRTYIFKTLRSIDISSAKYILRIDIQSLRSVLRLQKYISLLYVINVILNVLCCVVLCWLPSQSHVLCQFSMYHLSCSQSCFRSLNTPFCLLHLKVVNWNIQVLCRGACHTLPCRFYFFFYKKNVF